MSIYQLLGIFTGAISGLVWEILGTSPFKNIPTVTPSLIVNFVGKNWHLHHWLAYAAVALIIGFFSVKTGRFFHPSVLMIFGFLAAAILYDWIKFSDWYVLLK